MDRRPTDEEFEVVEEVIDDFDYFYEDEEDVISNLREKRKLTVFSVIISCVLVCLIVLFTGMIQMKIYNVKDTFVSKEVIRVQEYMEIATPAYEYARDFYSYKEVEGSIIESGIFVDIEKYLKEKNDVMIEELQEDYLNAIYDTCENYIGNAEKTGLLETTTLPKDERYQIFNSALIDTYNAIYQMTGIIESSLKVDKTIAVNYLNAKTELNIAYLALQIN